jgi:tellurite resistance protein TerC
MEIFFQEYKTLFLIFNLLVIIMLVIDLGLLSKQANKIMTIKKATIWTIVWIVTSFVFAGVIYAMTPVKPGEKVMAYIAGYLLEKSLSVDNLFVFVMIFQSFKIPPSQQPEVLKWGIIGAVILRAIMIFMGAALIQQFTWVLYIFGIFLFYTALKMLLHKESEEEFHPENSRIIQWSSKVFPVSKKPHNGHFFTKENGRLYVTSLFIVLLLVEVSDVMFAFDSIPAIFSITQDPFIVYTSNIFAILGLRALYFVIGGIMDLFKHLKTGVAIILAFVGAKLLLPSLHSFFPQYDLHIPVSVSLSVICGILFLSIAASIPSYIEHKKLGATK